MQWTDVHEIFINFRRRRMKNFYKLLQPSAQTRLLDVGGTTNTWLQESSTWLKESSGDEQFPVTLVNINPSKLLSERFSEVHCDAISLPFANESFDIAFSNSVIEHMTSWERQKQFASEIRRVAKKLWVQTPARCFPIESHTLTPFFQFLPRRLQKRMARYFTLRGLLTRPTPEEIDALLSDIRLLGLEEMKQLFPDCTILNERVLGLTKSYVAVRIPAE